MPPAFIDYVLRKDLADGVLITGCCEGDCNYRLGNTWMDQRFSGDRMPVLRTRVPRERVRTRWLGTQGKRELDQEIADFQRQLRRLADFLYKSRPVNGAAKSGRTDRPYPQDLLHTAGFGKLPEHGKGPPPGLWRQTLFR
mgnify:CR=1 FL=1